MTNKVTNEIFFNGIRSGNIESIKSAINLETDINSTQNGFSAILTATMLNQYEILKVLIDSGADIDSTDDEGWSALHWACNEDGGHLNIVLLLINSGIDINHNDNNGSNALLVATEFGHIKIIEYLIDNGIDVNTKNVSHGATALMLATQNSNIKAVELLINGGAKVDLLDNYGNKALFFAQHIQNREIYSGIVSILKHCEDDSLMYLDEIPCFSIGEVPDNEVDKFLSKVPGDCEIYWRDIVKPKMWLINQVRYVDPSRNSYIGGWLLSINFDKYNDLITSGAHQNIDPIIMKYAVGNLKIEIGCGRVKPLLAVDRFYEHKSNNYVHK
jgi:hypothetical protein